MAILQNDQQVLLELIYKRLEIFKEILNITQLQEKSIQNDDIDKLEKLIDSKQIKINNIHKLDSSYGDLLKNLKEKYRINRIQELNDEEIKLNMEEMDRIIRKIYKIDKKNNDDMSRVLNEVKSKLRGVKMSQKVSKGYYNKPAQAYGYFIDKKE